MYSIGLVSTAPHYDSKPDLENPAASRPKKAGPGAGWVKLSFFWTKEPTRTDSNIHAINSERVPKFPSPGVSHLKDSLFGMILQLCIVLQILKLLVTKRYLKLA